MAPTEETKERHEKSCLLNAKRVELTVDFTYVDDLVVETSMSIHRTIKSVNNANGTEISLTDDINHMNKCLLLKRALIETGTSKSAIKKKSAPLALLDKHKRKASVAWNTNASKFNTAHEVELPLMFPKFCPSKEMTHTFAVDKTENDSKHAAKISGDLIFLF